MDRSKLIDEIADACEPLDDILDYAKAAVDVFERHGVKVEDLKE